MMSFGTRIADADIYFPGSIIPEDDFRANSVELIRAIALSCCTVCPTESCTYGMEVAQDRKKERRVSAIIPLFNIAREVVPALSMA